MEKAFRYGAAVYRAFLSRSVYTCNYASQSIPRPLSLMTASSGISKANSHSKIVSKWSFGDDAYFVAKNKAADVIGKVHLGTICCVLYKFKLHKLYKEHTLN